MNVLILKGLENVLNDPSSGIPDGWQSVDGWMEMISNVRRCGYREGLDLYRWSLRKDPVQFFRNLGRAFSGDCGWLGHQLLNGLSSGVELNVDTVVEAEGLFNAFEMDWHPSAVDSKWQNVNS